MKKQFLSILVAIAILSFNSAVFADNSKINGLDGLIVANPSYSHDASSSENFILTDAKISKVSVPETKKVKKIELMNFSVIMKKVSNGALYAAQDKARAWLDKQNPESILGYSETVTCPRPGSCDAFVTIMYWRMVAIKEEIKREEEKK